MKALLLIAALLVSCAGSDRHANTPGCTDADYAKLVSSHALELAVACRDFNSLAECPEGYQTVIDQAYEVKYEKWRVCE